VMSIGMNSILIGFSATAVAVFGVYFRLQSLIFMPIFGLATAMISIVAFNYGARNKKRITSTIKLTILISFTIMSLGTALFQFFPVQLLKMFNASGDMLTNCNKALRTNRFAFHFAGIAIVLSVSFQALGKGFYSMMMSIVRQLVVLLPAAYLLSLTGDVANIWYSFLIAEGVSIIMALLLYSHIYKTKISRIKLPNSSK
nr:MATE family efflux transporter [Bacteroidales bacterium]